MYGLISNNSMSRITHCTTKVTPASDAHPVLVPLLPVRMFVPDAGGGKTPKSRSAVCIRTSGHKNAAASRLVTDPAVPGQTRDVEKKEHGPGF